MQAGFPALGGLRIFPSHDESYHSRACRRTSVSKWFEFPKGACAQIAYTLGKMYLYRECFKAKVLFGHMGP